MLHWGVETQSFAESVKTMPPNVCPSIGWKLRLSGLQQSQPHLSESNSLQPLIYRASGWGLPYAGKYLHFLRFRIGFTCINEKKVVVSNKCSSYSKALRRQTEVPNVHSDMRNKRIRIFKEKPVMACKDSFNLGCM
jgi:hypothetical protein